MNRRGILGFGLGGIAALGAPRALVAKEMAGNAIRPPLGGYPEMAQVIGGAHGGVMSAAAKLARLNHRRAQQDTRAAQRNLMRIYSMSDAAKEFYARKHEERQHGLYKLFQRAMGWPEEEDYL